MLIDCHCVTAVCRGCERNGTDLLERISQKQVSELDDDISEQNEAELVPQREVHSARDVPKIPEPREESLDFPSPAISPRWPPNLGWRPDSVRSMNGDHLHAASLQPLVESVAVVGHITDEAFRFVGEEHLVKKRINRSYFTRRSTLDIYGGRKTRAVWDYHDLGTLTAFGFPNVAAPFFAGTSVPSTKHSAKSIPPRSRSSRTNSSRTRLIASDLNICWNRRWHVR